MNTASNFLVLCTGRLLEKEKSNFGSHYMVGLGRKVHFLEYLVSVCGEEGGGVAACTSRKIVITLNL